jgi:TetR/AcrR family transcriptional regulator, cholesterol catabolism regulator
LERIDRSAIDPFQNRVVDRGDVAPYGLGVDQLIDIQRQPFRSQVARKRSLDEGPVVRESILSAGARLYSTRGFRATSIRDLADAAGISSSTMYHHFGNKQEILYAILMDFMRSFVGEIIPVLQERSRTPVQRIAEAVRLHLWISERDRLKLVIGAPLRSELSERQSQSLRVLQRDYRDAFRGAIQDGIDDGVFEAGNPLLSTTAILDMLNGVREWLDPAGPAPFEEVAEYYQGIVLKTLAASPVLHVRSSPSPEQFKT